MATAVRGLIAAVNAQARQYSVVMGNLAADTSTVAIVGDNAQEVNGMRQVGFTAAGMYYVELMRAQSTGRSALATAPTYDNIKIEQIEQLFGGKDVALILESAKKSVTDAWQASDVPAVATRQGAAGAIASIRPGLNEAFSEAWRRKEPSVIFNSIAISALDAMWSVGADTASGATATNFMNRGWGVDNTSIVMHMKDRGDAILDIGWGMAIAQVVTFTAGDTLTGNLAGQASGVHSGWKRFVESITPYLLGMSFAFLAFGFVLAIIVPTLPYVLWIAGIIGLLVLVVEALIASVLWVVALMHPAGDGFSSDQARNGLMLVMTLFLRPVLMLLGMICGIFLIEPAGRLINDSFFVMMRSVQGASVTGPVSVIGFGAVYTTVMLAAVYKIFSLTHVVPDRILRWIGGGGADLGESEFSSKLEGGGRSWAAVISPRGTPRGKAPSPAKSTPKTPAPAQ
jgi:conjugal transfer/type IV secretion protein DotA/TraY